MPITGIRFCHVAKKDVAVDIAEWLGEKGWGLEERNMGEHEGFQGAVFPSESAPQTWAEIYSEASGMPAGTMLQVVVDDADAYAETARANGIDVQGPMDAHGERIYFAEGPGGLQVAVLSQAK